MLGCEVYLLGDPSVYAGGQDVVRVKRRLMAPRESLSTAELPPCLLVFLTDHAVRLRTTARQEELRGKPGEFLWHSGGRLGIENLRDHRVEVAQIVPKFALVSEGASTTPTDPQNSEFENDLVRVRHLHRAQGRRVFVYVGPSSVFIQLSALNIKITHPDGPVEKFRMKAGDIRFENGGTFTVETETLGERLEALRVELRTKWGHE
jgi:hypothetical protein